MSEFDDPDLQRALRGAGGQPLDVDIALDRVQRRVRQVKRRRAVAVGSAACAVLFVAVAYAGTRSDDGGSLRPAGTGDDTSSSAATSSTDPNDTSTVTSVDTNPGTTTVTSTPSTTGDTSPTSSPPNTTQSTTHNTTGNTTGTSQNTTPSTPANTSPSPVTRSFSGVGGSVTVRLENGSLTLVSSNATAGFSADVRQSSGDRVEVRFESDDHRTEIRIDLVGGSMSPEIKED